MSLRTNRAKSVKTGCWELRPSGIRRFAGDPGTGIGQERPEGENRERQGLARNKPATEEAIACNRFTPVGGCVVLGSARNGEAA